MTREDAIARIKGHKFVHKMDEPRAIYISEALDMAIKALENESDWIPCSERLPKTDKWRTTFNVTTETGNVTSMDWENTIVRGKLVSRWIWKDRIAPWKIVAWMSLPKAWKEE